jgi:hypothetical protein
MAAAGSPSVATAAAGRSDLPRDVPVYVLAASIQWVVFHLTSIAPLVALDGRDGAVTAFLAIVVGGLGGLFASGIATAAVAVILDELDAGRTILAGDAYRRVFERWRPLSKGMATELGMILLLTVTVIGIPIRGPSLHPMVAVSLRHACSATRPPPNHCIAAPNW